MRAVGARKARKSKRRGYTRYLRWFLLGLFGLILAFHLFCALGMVALKWIDPWTTAVQMQRRVESFFEEGHYQKRYTFVPLSRISRELQHAVIAAEDGRFYQHRGIDWREVRKVVDEGIETGEVTRGASTITQQLVKNLFLTTTRNPVRKVFEYSLAPLIETILSKDRILELYLNVIEWGPGVYGAEAAAQAYYRVPAARLGREQSARLAAILPAPRTRKPARMNEYSGKILDRMRKMGW